MIKTAGDGARAGLVLVAGFDQCRLGASATNWKHSSTGKAVWLRVTHTRDLLEGTDHIEAESIKPKRASLLINETCYNSSFIDWRALKKKAGGPVPPSRIRSPARRNPRTGASATLPDARMVFFGLAYAGTKRGTPSTKSGTRKRQRDANHVPELRSLRSSVVPKFAAQDCFRA